MENDHNEHTRYSAGPYSPTWASSQAPPRTFINRNCKWYTSCDMLRATVWCETIHFWALRLMVRLGLYYAWDLRLASITSREKLMTEGHEVLVCERSDKPTKAATIRKRANNNKPKIKVHAAWRIQAPVRCSVVSLKTTEKTSILCRKEWREEAGRAV